MTCENCDCSAPTVLALLKDIHPGFPDDLNTPVVISASDFLRTTTVIFDMAAGFDEPTVEEIIADKLDQVEMLLSEIDEIVART